MPSTTSRIYERGLSRRNPARYIGSMEAPQSYAEGLAEATLILLIRSGAIEDGEVEKLADELDRRGSWERREEAQEAYREVAHGLRVAMLIGAAEAPMVNPEVEHRARYEREQMRRRTARLEQDR